MYIGFLGYVIVILFLTGSLILLTDSKAYKNANMKKEKIASLFLGWINISTGIALLAVQWISRYYFW
ncbi:MULTISPECIES: CLC_0170 family protein [Neobacillus]|uniref:Uncharacterized protein n=1 Tax=Neobacillus citreus TaxID=2833578 RepID=A0A942SU41_9BACI|nr:CLC_0170 family protein [Neobacillus citreus]MCH6265527.1 hypothetical protein [Neobacillus citreus]